MVAVAVVVEELELEVEVVKRCFWQEAGNRIRPSTWEAYPFFSLRVSTVLRLLYVNVV